MTITSMWREIEQLLDSAPDVQASLRPPLSPETVDEWERVIGSPLPPSLRELYALHGGADYTASAPFSFVGGWVPHTVKEAIHQFGRCKVMSDAWEIPVPIPFAGDLGGTNLVMPIKGSDELSIFFSDTPPLEKFASLEVLLSETILGLRGEHEDYRGEISSGSLRWVDLEEEE